MSESKSPCVSPRHLNVLLAHSNDSQLLWVVPKPRSETAARSFGVLKAPLVFICRSLCARRLVQFPHLVPRGCVGAASLANSARCVGTRGKANTERVSERDCLYSSKKRGGGKPGLSLQTFKQHRAWAWRRTPDARRSEIARWENSTALISWAASY